VACFSFGGNRGQLDAGVLRIAALVGPGLSMKVTSFRKESVGFKRISRAEVKLLLSPETQRRLRPSLRI